ncbi:MAG: LamG domain-containing protein, partial [Verrucomicrobiota bacterium]
ATEGRLSVEIIADIVDETPAESLFLQLSNPVNATLAGSEAEGTIIDDDIDIHLLNWSNRMAITFSGYDRPETLSNFTALALFHPGIGYNTFASGAGLDLRIANEDLTALLDYDIEQWDTNGNSIIWIRLPELAGSNATVWAYWGNPAATAHTGTAWDAAFHAVYHFAENTGTTAPDSGPAMADGTLVNMNDADWTAGRFGNGLDFDGIDDGVSTPVDIDQSTASDGITYEAWVFPRTANGSFERIFDADDGGWDWSLALDAAPRWDVFSGNNQFDSGHIADLGAWQYLSAVFDPLRGEIRVFKDGVQRTVNDLNYDTGDALVNIGSALPGNAFDGLIDEARIARVSRSTNWVWATWLNMASNDVFNTYGPVERIDPGAASLLAVYGATNITDNAAWLTARLTATGSLPSTLHVYWGTNNGGTVPANWENTTSLGPIVQTP